MMTREDIVKAQRFIISLDKLLLKMDHFLTDCLGSEQLSGYLKMKKTDLVDTLDFLKLYFDPVTLLQNILDQLLIKNAVDGNNNAGQRCVCQDSRFCVLPKTPPICSVRLASFAKPLVERMVHRDTRLNVYMKELLVKNYQGWLSVDTEHKYYAVITDCLLCLFQSDNTTLPSIITIKLDGSTAQRTDSTDQNAFTVNTLHDDILYFYTDTSAQLVEWITWINVGSQLSHKDLITEYRRQLEKLMMADRLQISPSGDRKSFFTKKAAIPEDGSSMNNDKSTSLTRPDSKSTTALRRKEAVPRKSSDDDVFVTKQPALRRHVSAEADVRPRPQSMSVPNSRDKRLSVGKKLVRTASTLLNLKQSGDKSTEQHRDADSGFHDLDSIDVIKRLDSGSGEKYSTFSMCDMSRMYEMQGTLLIKKMFKWQPLYCVVYNGIFNAYRNIKSTIPEIQVLLSECKITPVDERKVKKCNVFKISSQALKAVFFAADNPSDLLNWYRVFNEHIHEAVEIPVLLRCSVERTSGSEVDNQTGLYSRHDSPGQKPDSQNSQSERSSIDEEEDQASSEGENMKRIKETFSLLSRPDLHLVSRSTGDLPSLTMSSSSDEAEEQNSSSERLTPDVNPGDKRRKLLNKMKREKERLEGELRIQERQSQDEIDAELLKNMTRLKQRRVSTQLKYDFLEKQLADCKLSAEKDLKKTGVFRKDKRPVLGSTSDPNVHHIKKQMEELKGKLDSLDKGLDKSCKLRDESMNRVLHNKPGLTHPQSSSSSYDTQDTNLSKQRLLGLTSIIETLDTPSHYHYKGQSKANRRPHSTATCDTVKVSTDGEKTPLQIKPDTLALISEFESMTKELLVQNGLIDDVE